MRVDPMERCLSDLRIDQWLGGELGAAAARALEAHAARCATCAARVETLTAARDGFAAAPVPPALATAFAQAAEARPARPRLAVVPGGRDAGAPARSERAPAPPLPAGARPPARPRRRILLAVAPALAAAAAVLLWLRLPAPAIDPGAQASGAVTGSERVKGSARITVFVVRNGVARAAAPGEVVHPGDTLQITYTAAEPAHLAVLSRDGAGVASIYFDHLGRAAAITPGRDVPLPHSIVLDHVLGRETLYALFCARAVELAPARRSLEAGALAAPAGCRMEELVIEKRAP